MIERLGGWIGTKINGITFIVDLINACPLRCPSCAVGIFPKKDGAVMSIDLFRTILDKAQGECKIRKIQLYAFSDPCLHKDLHLFVGECTRRGIETSISTMLQTTNCDFSKVIEARPSEFRISFAGWENMSYYQKNAKPEVFNKKIEKVCALPRYSETKWTMAFHIYRDNKHEIRLAEDLARKHGLEFVAFPAIFMATERYVDGNYSKQDLDLISRLLETPEQGVSRMKGSTDYCQMQSKQIYIEANGIVQLCQLVYESRFKLVPYLSAPLKEIRKMIEGHTFCNKCKSMKGHIYQYCYADFIHSPSPIDEADKKRFGGKNVLRP